jgi:hypothetical protein
VTRSWTLAVPALVIAMALPASSEKPRALLVGVVDLGVVFAIYEKSEDVLKSIERDHELIESEPAMKQQYEALMLECMNEIDETIHVFCKGHKYDLILKTTTKGWGESSLLGRIYRAQVSTVVAYDEKLDVTEAIIEHLNSSESPKKKFQ